MEGLQALAATHTIRVPQVLELRDGVLRLEHLDFASESAEGFGERFGRALAQLHAITSPEPFGWPKANYIGDSPQVNTQTKDWLQFWRDSRLLSMLSRLPKASAELKSAVAAVIDVMPSLFEGYTPRSVLIHGDLWSGNWGMLADGTPVIFDPCVSYSDPEADLAMMELFGSPPAGFWKGYGAPHSGYAKRKKLYQLYHLLNHAVLFGGGYAQQALRCALSLL